VTTFEGHKSDVIYNQISNHEGRINIRSKKPARLSYEHVSYLPGNILTLVYSESELTASCLAKASFLYY
jgi:hypothetical protein